MQDILRQKNKQDNMRILVLFKMVPNLEDLTESDWETGEALRPLENYARPVINPEDESALELSLRLRDEVGADGVFLAAATADDGQGAQRMGKTLKALGFNRVSLTKADFDRRFCPERIVETLAPEIMDNFDIILTGSRSADGQNGLTSMYLAEFLGWPLVTEVLALRSGVAGHIELESLTDDGLIRQTIKLPLVLAVGNAPSAFLRVPTIKDRLKRGQEPLEIRPNRLEGQIESKKNLISLTALKRELKKRETKLIETGTPAEKAALLFSALKEWSL
jgi:electron transfer flavoprotein alpha/beta subunit